MDTSLTPYPMPPGVKRLMPFQDYPFNGDGYAAAEVLRLKEKHGLRTAIETGTCYGSTTLWMSDNFDGVRTCDVNDDWMNIAKFRNMGVDGIVRKNISWVSEGSPYALKRLPIYDKTLVFLDAHWGVHCPLLEELEAICDAGAKPVIMIHDWQVPGRPDLGHDHFPDGRPFELSAILGHLDAIYGAGGWDHHFNDKAEGAKRGILYVEPKV